MFNNDNKFVNQFMNSILKNGANQLFKSTTTIKKFDFLDALKSALTQDQNKFVKTATVDGVYSYQFEVPGFTKDSININNADRQLTVEGKSGTRTIAHDICIGADEILKVTLKLGILEIKLKEVKEKEKNTKINID